MEDKREGWHYKTVPCCSCCSFCNNVTYNDDWGETRNTWEMGEIIPPGDSE